MRKVRNIGGSPPDDSGRGREMPFAARGAGRAGRARNVPEDGVRLQPQCERVLPDPLTLAACFPAVAGKQE